MSTRVVSATLTGVTTSEATAAPLSAHVERTTGALEAGWSHQSLAADIQVIPEWDTFDVTTVTPPGHQPTDSA